MSSFRDTFLLLFIGIYCLVTPAYYMSHCQYTHELLHLFVSQAGQLYGRDVLVYNVHGLIHLAADVQNFGPLDSYSAFPFENFLGKLKKLVRKPNLPLQQVIHRLSEKKKPNQQTSENNKATFLRNLIIWCGRSVPQNPNESLHAKVWANCPTEPQRVTSCQGVSEVSHRTPTSHFKPRCERSVTQNPNESLHAKVLAPTPVPEKSDQLSTDNITPLSDLFRNNQAGKLSK